MRKEEINKSPSRSDSSNPSAVPMGILVTENDIRRNIIEYLRLKNVLCWVNQSVGVRGRRRNGTGYRNGTSDVFCLPLGKFCAIEVKKPGGVVSEEQMNFLSDVRAAGHIGFVAYSVRDVARELFNE